MVGLSFMNAQRIILKDDGTTEILFDEKCICGNPALVIDSTNPTYATCLSCLRVVRRMIWDVPEGKIEIWGIYFDPYLANTLAGQFINQHIEPLDPKRYPKDNNLLDKPEDLW